MILRRIRLILAEFALAEVDAEVARWYVHDGQLSTEPLDGSLTPAGRSLRELRIRAVKRLQQAGGQDPWPSVLRPPTAAQREGYAASKAHRVEQTAADFAAGYGITLDEARAAVERAIQLPARRISSVPMPPVPERPREPGAVPPPSER